MGDILRPIGIIARALDSISNIEFKEVDLTRGQYLYLVRICENPGIILEQLASLIKVDKTTAARAVQKLEKNGMIERRSDVTNKKIRLIFPTDKGREVYPFIIRENEYSNLVALKGLSEEEQKQLGDLLLKVELNISDDWEYVKAGHKRNY
ncbi:MarR family winged helix-turn-helix transcriptional regulator [Companilactobacillus jidongensis]|uniref:MarR family winged helix-turn-helix transcriptional regulator n=1 Tax=Companilactobacillus jidongensis TaxID=2486006 RepID=UPI000F79F761|nr:MarR family transcriptional regulator [Companilactobacillus jidongensis]